MSQARRERRVTRIAIAVALAFGGIALAGLATAHSLGLAATEDANVWLPDTPNGQRALIERRFTQQQGVAAEDIDAIRKYAEHAPLADLPFTYLGFAALQDNDVERAESLMAEARSRRPRSRIARLGLLQIFGQRGDVEAMTGELVPLIRLEPELVEPLSAQWLQALRSPEDVATIAKILADDPRTYERVAEQAARANLPPDHLAAFLDHSPESGESRRFDRVILGALVEQGEYDAAFASWRQRSGVDRADASSLFNPDFTQRSAPPPFNWEIVQSRQGVAEFGADGGVMVDYFGRGADVLLRQLVQLAPGAYSLDVEQTSDDPRGAGLLWAVRCANSETVLLRRPVRSASGGASFEARFTVPPGCGTQWVELSGRGELRAGDGQRVEVSRVDIRKGGGAR